MQFKGFPLILALVVSRQTSGAQVVLNLEKGVRGFKPDEPLHHTELKKTVYRSKQYPSEVFQQPVHDKSKDVPNLGVSKPKSNVKISQNMVKDEVMKLLVPVNRCCTESNYGGSIPRTEASYSNRVVPPHYVYMPATYFEVPNTGRIKVHRG